MVRGVFDREENVVLEKQKQLVYKAFFVHLLDFLSRLVA